MRSPAATGAPNQASPADELKELRAERDRFVGFAFAGGELLLQLSSDHRVVFAAGAVKFITGAEPSSVVGRTLSNLVSERDRGRLETALRQAKAKGRLQPITLSFERGSAGAIRAVLSGQILPKRDDGLYLVVNRVVSAAAVDGKRDAATGLLDKQSFGLAAKTIVTSENPPQDLSLALVQLKGIQELRTQSGDRAVDTLLDEIGAFLRLHAVDGATAGRLSADQFGVVRAASAVDAGLKPGIERLVRAADPQGRTLRVDEHGVKLDTAGLSAADAARALAFTLNRFVANPEGFSVTSLADGFRAQIADTVANMSKIKNVVLAKKIEVAFQPIVDLRTRALHHHEMLARFEMNASPYQLINFAEQIGMIEDIDLLICQRGISILSNLRGDNAAIAINVSGRSLGSDLFVQSLIELCGQQPKLRERILFEVTESVAVADLARAGRILTELRAAGHRICLDDFGAGASSFPYLQALPVDFVKIDGAYIDRMATSRKDRAIIVAVVSMCGELGVETIAEKIETEDQARALAELGVCYGQGYLFGKPSVSPVGLTMTPSGTEQRPSDRAPGKAAPGDRPATLPPGRGSGS